MNTNHKNFGKLIFLQRSSIGGFVPVGLTFIGTLLGTLLGTIFLDNQRPPNPTAGTVMLAFILSFVPSVIGSSLIYYRTLRYLRFYEHGFIEKKWRKRVVTYDQVTCTWLEEDCIRVLENISKSSATVIIRQRTRKSYKKDTFSIFPNEEAGGGQIVFTFDDLNRNSGERHYNPNRFVINTATLERCREVRDRINASQTSENQDTND
ncbi:MAG: hypothetical protein LBQ50_14825 [Planctomycetaceae bacterium]|jgi:hypothetical protein|nr:hypothetical protein [Planctomycetaceae bacterium]